MSKRQKENQKLSKEEDEIINKIRKEIYLEQLLKPSELPNDEIMDKLEALHDDGEISDETYQYINDVLKTENPK